MGMRQDFQSAVNDVLGRWGDSGALTNSRDDASRLGRYRQLREHNLNVESQAVTVTSDETSHKVQPRARPSAWPHHCVVSITVLFIFYKLPHVLFHWTCFFLLFRW